jgi:hypothetical protein
MPAHLLGATGDNIVYGPTVAGQYSGAEAVNVLGSVAAEYIRQLDHGALKIIHQCIDGFCCRSLCFFGQMRVNTGRGRRFMPQPGLDQPQVDTGF